MRMVLAFYLLLVTSSMAQAHSAERGFVLLLPTGLIIAAGALAVAMTFAALVVVPSRWFKDIMAREYSLGVLPLPPARLTSLASFLIILYLADKGFTGTRDPLENLLPLCVWILWWVAIVLLHPLIGNLWGLISPLAWLEAKPRAAVPAYVPSLVIFGAFAWFQLVSAAPEDPAVLAMAVLAYLALGLAGVVLFGTRVWLAQGDPFSVFLRLLAAASPFRREANGVVHLRLPGSGLAGLAGLPVAGVLFVLLTLSSVSFDGFANTFTWLTWGGINPLEFPGRTAAMAHNTLGLAGAFLLLTALYVAAIGLGWMVSRSDLPLIVPLGRFVYSLIPISIAVHFAHYLVDLLVNGQYLLVELGLQHSEPTNSFLNTASGAVAIFGLQALAIVIGHAVGVVVGHCIALDLAPNRSFRLELPLAALMVLYTAFGLWTLSSPAIG